MMRRIIRKYLNWVDDYSKEYDVAIYAYCLMSNHVHFIVVPKNKNSLSVMFNAIHMRYAQYKNKKRKANEHLWQGRLFSIKVNP
jgi:putative transposase